jgi:hypothetical protein
MSRTTHPSTHDAHLFWPLALLWCPLRNPYAIAHGQPALVSRPPPRRVALPSPHSTFPRYDHYTSSFYVKSLYKRYLTNSLNWVIRRDTWRQRAIEIRAEFERNRCVGTGRGGSSGELGARPLAYCLPSDVQ